MKVAELAELAGVSPRSVRHYERHGLLSARRMANGYRDFPTSEVNRVKTIKELIDSGLTVFDIAQIKPCLSVNGQFTVCDLAAAVLHKHVKRLEASIERDLRTLQLLKTRLDGTSSKEP